MKIAQVVCAWPPYSGGIGNSAYQIEELLKENHTVISFNPGNTKPWLKYGHGAFMPQLLWKLRKFDYIYLHYPFFGSAEVVWLFSFIFKKPKIILHYHMDVKNLSVLAKVLSLPSCLIRNSLLKRSELIVSASLDYIKHSQIKKFYKKNPNKFTEIPFGIDTKKYQPKLIDRPSDNKILEKTKGLVHYVNDKFIKKNRLDIIFVGGLDKAHYFKGVENLIQALLILPSKNWTLKIVGDGDLKTKYENLSKKLKLADKIKFTGKLTDKDLVRAIQYSDLLVLPSINSNEAFGLVLIEAMACGVPVIASDLPGVRSVFHNYQQGLLVESGNIEDLKQKLDFIINNEPNRKEMAIAARKLAKDKYDLDIMKHHLEEIFN